MADLKWDVPATEEVQLDSDELAGIERGIQDVENGRYVSLEAARRQVSIWISKVASPRPR
jgi:predicted transcriptional regulator